jgi:hypothetical protein
LTKQNVIVLDVIIAGKPATAYGPDYLSMLRGGPLDELQKGLGQPVTWEATNDGMPELIRIVSDDQSQVLTELRFKECSDIPRPEGRARVPPAAAVKAPSPANVAPDESDSRPDVQVHPKPAPDRVQGARPRDARPKAKSEQTGGEPFSPPQGAIY